MANFRDQSNAIPYRRKVLSCSAMFERVHSFGWIPRAIAAFSAGSPKASHPMGCSTLFPRIHMNLAMMSLMAKASAWPMWRSPEGYGNMCSL